MNKNDDKDVDEVEDKLPPKSDDDDKNKEDKEKEVDPEDRD